MKSAKEEPIVGAQGLVTVAYLKARLDSGEDHLGIFMPLVLDVLPKLPNRHFTSVDVQQEIETTHAVRMPEATVATLLRRAARRKLLYREHGRFRAATVTIPRSNIAGQKEQLARSQERFATALISHAERRGVSVDSADTALRLLLQFISEQHIYLLLDDSTHLSDSSSLDRFQHVLIAEFIHDVANNDPALNAVLTTIVQGLVLYHASFLPDLASIDRKFTNLNVVFDSTLVRQALGFEGTSAEILMKETIALLDASEVRCIMFDKSIHEIQRILRVYQQKLGSHTGRLSLKTNPMTRHFLTQQYSPSDVQEMIALLENRITELGVRIVSAPKHLKEFTHNEVTLAQRLADRDTGDTEELRVRHDVDCVAGVLTLRRGFRTGNIEDAQYVFATASPLVIQNVQKWWKADERETSVGPVVSIRTLANLAWLKKPSISGDLQLDELVALCAVAMRPSERTWGRFLRHLDRLRSSRRLSEDQIGAIIASSITDELLKDSEVALGDEEDVDAGTLDEVVERVSDDYRVAFDSELREVVVRYEQKIQSDRIAARKQVRRANMAADEIANQIRRRDVELDRRAGRWARKIVGIPYWAITFVVVFGSAAVAVDYGFRRGWVGMIVGSAVLVVMVLEVFGVLRHLRTIRDKLETG